MILIPVPGFGAGVLTKAGSLESYIDRLFLPGKLHSIVYDPEGILSIIPAIGGFNRLAPVNWQVVGQTVSVTFLPVLLLYFPFRKKIFLKV